ncbi:hypothetical protein, partial [Pseudomonas mandelii]|uniref:hypothetical protein n=1 Tax=Pseudomonas mandelii TaxID=75612 RepID=UPI001E2A830F
MDERHAGPCDVFGKASSASTLAQGKRHCTPSKKNGSSRITGKDALDLHEKEFAIPVAVRH